MEDLSTLGADFQSAANAINDKGQIVGQAEVSASHDLHAVIWENGKMTDLNTFVPTEFGWVLRYATGINRHGQIIVNGYRAVYDGQTRTFLLTPSRHGGDRFEDIDRCSSSQ